MTEPADLVIPSQWTHLDVSSLRGTLMVIGASDTGKSTLARYLYQELCRAGRRAAYLDGDVGQSTLGLPTTMTVALSSRPGDERFDPHGPRASYFVGSTTPRGHMLPMVVGAYRLQQKALSLGAEAVVVDTTGLVDPADGGRALKQWKIELLAPSASIRPATGSRAGADPVAVAPRSAAPSRGVACLTPRGGAAPRGAHRLAAGSAGRLFPAGAPVCGVAAPDGGL